MKDIIVEVISEGLQGRFTHRDSIAILAGLTHEQARQQVIGNTYSSWEILYHTVFWQDRFVDMIGGEEIDIGEEMKDSWPASMKEKEHEWGTLVKRFKKGIVIVCDLLKEGDLTSRLKSYRGAPALKAFTSLAQHNSYHLGQIVMNRKAQGSWSP